MNGSDQLAYVYRDKTILNFLESGKLLKQIVPEHLDHINTIFELRHLDYTNAISVNFRKPNNILH